MGDPGSLVAGITLLVLLTLGVLASIILRIIKHKRRRQKSSTGEEGMIQITSTRLRVETKVPPMPKFKTRSSISMATSPIVTRSPKTPKSPGIRFAFTPPSVHSRKSGSIDSLPGIESVLEQYERDADASATQDAKDTKMVKHDDIGESGPAIEEVPLVKKSSVWDRPHLATVAEAV